MTSHAPGDLIEVDAPAGRITGLREDGVAVFRGIRYAEPPVGDLRFAPPVPAARVETIDATTFGPISLQDSDPLPLAIPGAEHNFYDLAAVTSEDCLNLNVWTPDVEGAAAVYVYIHGGAFLYGSGTGAWTAGAEQARRNGLVVVTLNYRLGILGGLWLGDHDPDSSDLAIQDQIAALRWVRENIAAFGGDPDKVTIGGQSAGAMSVAALLVAPAARGLFRGAVIESGHVAALFPVEQARATTADLLHRLGVDATGDVLAQLRSLSTLRILAVQREVGIGGRIFPTITDGHVLAEHPLEALRAGSADGVDLIVGTTTEEDRLFAVTGWASAPDVAKTLRSILPSAEQVAAAEELYRDEPGTEKDRQHIVLTDQGWGAPARSTALAHAGAGNRVFHYEFAWKSDAHDGLVGAAHLVDLPFTFGNLDAPGFADLAGPSVVADPATRALGDGMSDAWARFVATGSPSGGLLGEWPAFTSDDRRTMVLDRRSRVEQDRNAARLDFWESQTDAAAPLSTIGATE